MKLKIHKNIELFKTPEYQLWFKKQTFKEQIQISERLSKIETDSYFGDHKGVSDVIWELKWKNGRRVYYAYIAKLDILILLGGNKNGQDKDIKRSKSIFKKYIGIHSEK